MNFQDLCEFVAEEVNGRSRTFSTVTLADITEPFDRKVIRTIQKAYKDVQLHSRYWRFRNRRGVLFTLRNGVREYPSSQIESVDWDSLYLTKSGTTARWPIYKGDFTDWKQRERYETETTGIPDRMYRMTNPDNWVFFPTPDAAYTLNGEIWYKPDELTTLTDKPCWDEEYHEMLAWLAIRRLERRVKTRDEVVTGHNAADAQDAAISEWSAFCTRYLPETGQMPTLM